MIILASASPRRKMLLESAGLTFRVEAEPIDETQQAGETPLQYVRRLSSRKAQAVSHHHETERIFVIAADTIVVHEGIILGKPADTQEAHATLRRLSNTVHTVMTGVCVIDVARKHTKQFVCETRVHFAALSDEGIARYIKTGEPLDKAGAYGIQGRAAMFVTQIEGSYTNVVGLPLCETLRALENLSAIRCL